VGEGTICSGGILMEVIDADDGCIQGYGSLYVASYNVVA